MTDNEKLHFYGKTTIKQAAKRVGNVPTRRRNSIRYYIPCQGENVRVCKVFYLTTLDISHKRVCTYHNLKQAMGGTPVHLRWGDSANNVVPQAMKDGIESHYCRSTNKEYLAQELSITVLYDKYVNQCQESGRNPCKLHLYRQIFNQEFNIDFHVPKKDRCDTCEAMKMNEEPTEEEKEAHAEHLKCKLEAKERKRQGYK